MYFEDLDLNYDLLDGLDAMGFAECTPIQEQAISVALDGDDILASAQTGTGKTAAFILPILELLSRKGASDNCVNALILMPTRELVQQVDQMLEGFAYYQNTTWVPIYGGNDGVHFAQQQRALKQGGDIAIATPGRLLSLLRMGGVDLSKVEYLVLDEADRMLDIGFYDDIMEIIGHLPKKRQTMMFSATYPDDVAKLAKKILYKPVEIKIAISKPAEGVAQYVCFAGEEQKSLLLMRLLREKAMRTVVFFSSKDKVKTVFREMRTHGFKAVQIHSDLSQIERSEALLKFKTGAVQVMLATDLVARGIDVDGVELVINYDVPHQFEDYVHRVGRTARAGSKGEAIMFVTNRDRRTLKNFEDRLEYSIAVLRLDGFDMVDRSDERKPMKNSRGYKGKKSFGKRGEKRENK